MAEWGKNVLKVFPYPQSLELRLDNGREVAFGIRKGRLISRGETLATFPGGSLPDLVAPLPGKVLAVSGKSIQLEVDLDLGLKVEPLDFSLMGPMEAQEALRRLGLPSPRAPRPLEPVFISGFDPEPGIKLSLSLFEDQRGTLECGVKLLQLLFPGKTLLQVLPKNTRPLSFPDAYITPKLKYPHTLSPLLKKKILKKAPFDHLASGVVDARTLYLLGSAYRSGSSPILWPMTLEGRPSLIVPGTRPMELLSQLNLSVRDGDTIVLGGLARGKAVADVKLGLSPNTYAVNLIRGGIVREIKPCIRCGRCREICPLSLPVDTLGGTAFHLWQDLLSVEKKLDNCPECALCAHICPSGIPLSLLRRTGTQRPLISGKQDD
ncbi:MAG: 4Fe-4S dicluster domain-containing protein [Deltaproteobacteria bacterium]|jgi:electron transport complex protein RnfC|nr:4Fe-4S dicluster domain-containing protein [Deltaproteobacteria bacterium]